jgi:hypothetical protein
MRTYQLLPAVLLGLCLGCGGSAPGPTGPGNPGDPSVGLPSSYDIIFGPFVLKGNSGVETSWSESNGLLYLGADDITTSIGTVTLQLGPISTGTNGTRRAEVLTAVVSGSLVRVGTAEELGARLYRRGLGYSEISGIRTGQDYIEGTLNVFLEQISPAAAEGVPPATTMLTGTFRAVNN